LREVYLDNCATTRTDPDVAEVALEMMTKCYGNPSSLHKKGLEAQLLLEKARGQIAGALGCEPQEIYFTSGGTEANNLAILGAVRAHHRRAKGLVSNTAEHSSVLGALRHLSEQGGDVTLIDPLPSGCADTQKLTESVDENTLLLSCAMVNSEVGGISPIGDISMAAKAKNSRVLVHCDAVQALGKLPVSVKKLGVDLLSVSGHKLHTPKGIGALYIRRGVRIHPIMYGAEQQKSVRPGTENTPLACAFGAAVEKNTGEMSSNLDKFIQLRKLFLKIAENMPGICINSAPLATPYICNISAPGYRSETMLHFLAERGIYISSGSACSKGKDSHVLAAIGLPRDRIQSALRISFCKDSTEQDIRDFFKALGQGMSSLTRVGS